MRDIGVVEFSHRSRFVLVSEMVDLPVSFRVIALTPGNLCNYLSANEATLKNMAEYVNTVIADDISTTTPSTPIPCIYCIGPTVPTLDRILNDLGTELRFVH